MLDPVFTSLAALCGALLFGAAAVHKWRAFGEFSASIVEYRLLPPAIAPVAAFILAAIETIVCALLLCVLVEGGWYVQAFGALLGAALLVVYAAAMAVNLIRGRRDLDCGCGLVRKTISASMIVRNLALAALIACASMPDSARALGVADYVTIVAALAICTLLYASTELLLGRAAPRRSVFAEAS